MKNTLNLINFFQKPILYQLQLEEALLRTSSENWCLINKGSSPAIVMGISGDPQLLINKDHWDKNPIPIIRRFSGGGTVVVDENTLFITFIFNSNDVGISCCPQKVLQWSAQIYHPIFGNAGFQLAENDYAIGSLKFGGNAQYFRKDRWLHHSSLLWDYHEDRMNYLLMPQKMPAYRQGRSHNKFLCRLKDFYPCQDKTVDEIIKQLEQKFVIKEKSAEVPEKALGIPHRQATSLLRL